MRVLYFDCFAGVSGDMVIGALLDLGLDFDHLKESLSSLGLGGYLITAEKVKRSAIAATKFNVEVEGEDQPARHLRDIAEMINRSSLSKRVKRDSIRVFTRLGEAEARIHNTTIDRVHFHEVGAVDSIIDVVGAVIGFEALGVERFYSSPLRVGYGAVKTAHGLLPVPAPATADLLGGVPIYAGEIEGEFVTPTGAAIVTSFVEAYEGAPGMKLDRAGYGAGSRDPKGLPNALRLMLGEIEEGAVAGLPGSQGVKVIETNLDDMSPQVFGFVMERAFELGALDVFMIPAQMKKGRPGVLLTALCEEEKLESIIEMLLAETSTLGVRYYDARRRVLERAFEEVSTRYGKVRIKVARHAGRTLHFQPEYDDCARIAREARVALIDVQTEASAAFHERQARREGKEDGDS
jgi:uncharacterized protein (TIGR00299 family) protein